MIKYVFTLFEEVDRLKNKLGDSKGSWPLSKRWLTGNKLIPHGCDDIVYFSQFQRTVPGNS